MSTGPSFRHEYQRSIKVNGDKHSRKESILDGEKGLSFHLTKKEAEKFYRINVKETSKDKFEVKEKIDDKEETINELDMSELKKMLKTNKELEFVKNYVDKERGNYKGGASKKVEETKGVSSKDSKKVEETKDDIKKTSIKTSNKVVETKGGAKKTSKKASKKTTSKKTTKTASKKTSKTASKKTSKLASKK